MTDDEAPLGPFLHATVDADGVYGIPAHAVPPSELTSEEYRRSLVEHGRRMAALRETGDSPVFDFSTVEGLLRAREASDTARKKIAEDLRKDFRVTIEEDELGGVPVDRIRPADGVDPANERRVLINLHGGGMVFGARYEGWVASIPIASLGRIEVVTVDYRMAPEHRHPAATGDVAAVYAALLERFDPASIGIYGHSAGAFLTASATAWFAAHGLPRPGAIALDGSGAVQVGTGDSAYFGGAFMFGIPRYPPVAPEGPGLGLYFEHEDMSDPFLSPALHPDVIAAFPPTLVLNATRDPSLSSALYTHRQLVKHGVPTELHVWEGVPHSFHYDASLPESRDAYATLLRFFATHLH